MLNLKKVEKLLGLTIGRTRLFKTQNECQESIYRETENVTETTKSLVWPHDVLPQTNYTKKHNSFNLEKIEKISQKKVTEIKPEKLALKISWIDLSLIKNVVADDLVKYDGRIVPTPLLHIQNYNSGLFKWFVAELNFKYLKKMAEKSLELNNFNLLSVIIQAMQYMHLNPKEKEKIIHYKRILKVDERGIFPFDWVLKDCADSNINASSEIASLRFCKIIEKLQQMKKLEPVINIKEKDKQYVFGKVWKYLNYKTREALIKKQDFGKFYLVI